jgi:hypothetical protein
MELSDLKHQAFGGVRSSVVKHVIIALCSSLNTTPFFLLLAQVIYARPKACKFGACTTLDYNRRESASDSRCMHAILGQDARLPKSELSEIYTTGHYTLG